MRWIYPAGWVVLLLVYWVALVINGFPTEMALRVAITNYLPDALLGLAVFRLPLFVRWSDEKKGRFIATHFLVLVDFVPVAGSMSNECSANFDIVLGVTPSA